MTMLRFEDLGAYAEARHLARVCREHAARARGPELLGDLAAAALYGLGGVTMALHAGAPQASLAPLVAAADAVLEVRALAYDAYLVGALDPGGFDEVMAAAARTSRELERLIAATRVRARYSGMGAPPFFGSLGTTGARSSSSTCASRSTSLKASG